MRKRQSPAEKPIKIPLAFEDAIEAFLGTPPPTKARIKLAAIKRKRVKRAR
jgi:hypothetical protein